MRASDTEGTSGQRVTVESPQHRHPVDEHPVLRLDHPRMPPDLGIPVRGVEAPEPRSGPVFGVQQHHARLGTRDGVESGEQQRPEIVAPLRRIDHEPRQLQDVGEKRPRPAHPPGEPQEPPVGSTHPDEDLLPRPRRGELTLQRRRDRRPRRVLPEADRSPGPHDALPHIEQLGDLLLAELDRTVCTRGIRRAGARDTWRAAGHLEARRHPPPEHRPVTGVLSAVRQQSRRQCGGDGRRVRLLADRLHPHLRQPLRRPGDRGTRRLAPQSPRRRRVHVGHGPASAGRGEAVVEVQGVAVTAHPDEADGRTLASRRCELGDPVAEPLLIPVVDPPLQDASVGLRIGLSRRRRVRVHRRVGVQGVVERRVRRRRSTQHQARRPHGGAHPFAAGHRAGHRVGHRAWPRVRRRARLPP